MGLNARQRWVRAVGRYTSHARSLRAERHEAIADSEPNERTSRAVWHLSRARAQRERIQRVEECGQESVDVFCVECGVVHEHERRCAGWRYCLECRGARAQKLRKRFTESREAWLRKAKGYERERFLTLTAPHGSSADVDVRMMIESWERFVRGLRRWLLRRLHRVHYLRALEVTESDGGHAHMHVWIGSSFLPHAVLRVLWGRALAWPDASGYVPVRALSDVLPELRDDRERAELLAVASWRGRVRAFVPWPVLDVRVVHGDPSAELVKYMLKDIGTEGSLLEPEVAARLIEATEGTRTVAASRGFWVVLVALCKDCGASRWAVLGDGSGSRRRRHEPGGDRFP